MKIKFAFFLCSLGLLAVNTATVLAQPVEVVVTGGGFNIRGPGELTFAAQPFSFDNQISIVNFSSTPPGSDLANPVPAYLEITDENGGSAFNVAFGADNLTPVTDLMPNGTGVCVTGSCIPKVNLAVRNNDGSSPAITTIEGPASAVSLDPSTNFSNEPAATLDQQRILLNGNGSAPGTWRIYPQLQETTPGNTAIGIYSGSITITIMTT